MFSKSSVAPATGAVAAQGASGMIASLLTDSGLHEADEIVVTVIPGRAQVVPENPLALAYRNHRRILGIPGAHLVQVVSPPPRFLPAGRQNPQGRFLPLRAIGKKARIKPSGCREGGTMRHTWERAASSSRPWTRQGVQCFYLNR